LPGAQSIGLGQVLADVELVTEATPSVVISSWRVNGSCALPRGFENGECTFIRESPRRSWRRDRFHVAVRLSRLVRRAGWAVRTATAGCWRPRPEIITLRGRLGPTFDWVKHDAGPGVTRPNRPMRRYGMALGWNARSSLVATGESRTFTAAPLAATRLARPHCRARASPRRRRRRPLSLENCTKPLSAIKIIYKNG
jgi:hypothetical protein